MTNTIHNVPRELLAELQEHIHCHHDAVLWGKVCDLLSAPSPAGVDGLVAVKVWEADADWDDHELVVRLSDAQVEIQALAHQWGTLIAPLFPVSWDALTA